MLVYQCEDSVEGIFSAIGKAYEEKRNPEETMISLTEELFLFAEYQKVESDSQKAAGVMHMLVQRFGGEDYDKICFALASEQEEKAQAVYQTIALGLKNGVQKGHLLDAQADGQVRRVFELARNAAKEYDHWRGFLRFEELKNGVLYAELGSKNRILTFLMQHFADRFPSGHFIIYDEMRGVYGIHPSREVWYLFQGEEIHRQILQMGQTDEEKSYQELFRHFCHKIAIEDRENLKLQRGLLPLRFQHYMVEFQ